jgi:hypothetical protein
MLGGLMESSPGGAAPHDRLLASGHPLHTRMLTLELFREDAAALRVEGTILDLRKCGFVPTGGEIQTGGVVHQMHWRARVLDPSGRIAQLEIAQPVVAMERSAATGGECCRDPAPRLQALVGSAFDAGFAKRLASAFGGPLGCSHLLTLGQALGAFVPERLGEPAESAAVRAPGERVAKRVVAIDGFEREDGALELAIQLADYAFAPLARVQNYVDRLGSAREVRVHAEVAPRTMTLAALRAFARERGAAHEPAAWRALDADVAPLAGDSALRGMASRIRARAQTWPGAAVHALLAEALLQLAPALIQCMPALSHRPEGDFVRAAVSARTGAAASPALMSGGLPDSCFMWRSGGAAARQRLG